ncbi:MAG: SprT family zinc-dependent metalloprotease [Pseudomonadota bacterium]|jgi:predicted metal-dependent hydrolase|uniref:M48 family metallopeptidase n=1 Tax=Alcanivorax sp. TaxID=1872427 RepID=UPI000C4CF989|nr:SprT family zinc-dependent metalloprotease [Alcanivorax sp.]MBU86087.1 metal-dependent hydrolase [Alcanivorax sp.]MED5238155.1 SprT family zinc-dependent metalloprotease [Pseudomonadota bacterium]MEE3320428.1 SprT family zinc-dependent metalloprotease [Pseudomonadota bacterium]
MTDIQTSRGKTYAIQYGDRRLQFAWRQRDKAGTRARIHVYPNGLVEVETPQDTTLAEAKQALLKRARWVTRHLAEIKERRSAVLEREYVSGETVFYLGRRYTLKVIPSETEQHVKMLRGQIRVTARDLSPGTVKARLTQWYRERADEVFARRLDAVSDRLPWVVEMPPWMIREMKTQWGSCSPSGVILLNPHLVKTPTRCIDYVILHELCHLEEHNHSDRFYRLLKRAMPDWEGRKSRLDAMSELYLNQ